MIGLALITGGAGFIGCNLADALAADGCEVWIYDDLSRKGAAANLGWLEARHPDRVRAIIADVRDEAQLAAAVRRADAVFHLAAQVAVTTSLERPRDDFAVNAAATVALLEAARAAPTPPAIVFASTNKVYGDLADVPLVLGPAGYAPSDPDLAARGVDETRPLAFRTPYGCSKGAAEQYVLDYAASFGLPAVVLRLSCVFGRRQTGGEEQGWVAHLLRQVATGGELRLFGDGWQVRDLLDVADAVAAFRAAAVRSADLAGRAFNLGGGPANAASVRAVLAACEDLFGRRARVCAQPWRAGDQRWYVSDARAAAAALGLAAPRPWRDVLAALAGAREPRDFARRALAPT